MEFQIKAKIDWIGDDGSLDEAVKNEIVERIVKTLSKSAIADITEAAKKRIDKQLDALVSGTYDDFMQQGITVTDEWGKPVYENVKIIDLIKKKLTGALAEKVDENGRPCEYGGRPRLDHMIDERVKYGVREIVSSLDEKIKERLSAAVKEKLSASLLAKIDVEAVVKDVLGKLRGTEGAR